MGEFAYFRNLNPSLHTLKIWAPLLSGQLNQKKLIKRVGEYLQLILS